MAHIGKSKTTTKQNLFKREDVAIFKGPSSVHSSNLFPSGDLWRNHGVE